VSVTENLIRTQTARRFALENARVVTPTGVIEDGTVVVQDARITEVTSGPATVAEQTCDAHGQYLLPGFIDLHCDAIEKAIQPRPGGQFPLDAAIIELDKRLAACGVTTMCHCICFLESDGNDIRSWKMARKVARHLHEQRDHLLVNNWVHARLEITVQDALPTLHSLLESGHVQLLSFMDHSPGQGQFTSQKHFRDYYSRARKLSRDKVQALAERRLAAKENFDDLHLQELAQLSRTRGIPLASHDDDTPDKVAWMHRLGVRISEFPVRMAAARAARHHGMHVLMGAPNILRGHSLTGNLSGRRTIEEGCCDVIASDFAPMSLLHAIFTLSRLGTRPLHELVRMVTTHPAEVLGIDAEVGSIEEGKRADLILIDPTAPVPRITQTYAAGHQIFSSPLLPSIRGTAQPSVAHRCGG
jgi:alpha-D-ribose 1-methylphosphonate 5-triphosphate diphosphatase